MTNRLVSKGVDFLIVRAEYHQDLARLMLWDVGGRGDGTRFQAQTWRGAHVLLLCFAVDDPRSFEVVGLDLAPKLELMATRPPKVFLVGLKSDTRRSGASSELVPRADAEALAAKIGVDYVELSAFDYVKAFGDLPESERFEPHRCNPAGGLEEFLSNIVVNCLETKTFHVPTPKPAEQDPKPLGLLTRIWRSFSSTPGNAKQPDSSRNTDKKFTGSEVDYNRFIAVLMCKHPRLGHNCPPSMREIPPEVWVKIFAQSKSPVVKFFFQ
eukprot:c7550_g1_i1.p1 GENE.c7550_g1_i1~~c7550_g1_i1.p1  ORF type:complete len:268 (+),score=45.91 c7550_g1_i1:202-1005(+)